MFKGLSSKIEAKIPHLLNRGDLCKLISTDNLKYWFSWFCKYCFFRTWNLRVRKFKFELLIIFIDAQTIVVKNTKGGPVNTMIN